MYSNGPIGSFSKVSIWRIKWICSKSRKYRHHTTGKIIWKEIVAFNPIKCVVYYGVKYNRNDVKILKKHPLRDNFSLKTTIPKRIYVFAVYQREGRKRSEHVNEFVITFSILLIIHYRNPYHHHTYSYSSPCVPFHFKFKFSPLSFWRFYELFGFFL